MLSNASSRISSAVRWEVKRRPLSNNLLLVTAGSQAIVNQRFSDLPGIAHRTRALQGATVSLYQRGSLAANEPGVSQVDRLCFLSASSERSFPHS